MRKFIKYFLVLGLFLSASALAQVETEQESLHKRQIHITGFNAYPPFGEWDTKEKVFTTAFDKFIEKYAKERKFLIIDDFRHPEYKEIVREVRRGNVDMIMGIYYESDTYTGLDYVFPSFVSNPVVVIMLPNRIDEAKGADDLKKLKGAVNTQDQFSDYVNREIAKFNVERVDGAYDTFEKLFKGEVDYVFSGYYFGIVEAAKLGLRKKIAFSKQVIWEIPMFIGLSKVSEKRNFLIGNLRLFIDNNDVKSMLKQSIEEHIRRYEEKYIGVVPPSYSSGVPDADENEDDLKWKPIL
ncbi:MAG: transporter substrate-binding domain-containing protein [Lactobacillus sp.]|jgi:ABC-type amino acid transport substrate-binding protein|nr:transporter substrate-binding domain-containing protein [Lactobacillus sp.]